jgi:acetyl-CoA C-acetyltransferase
VTDIMILSACRTPIGSFGGALKDVGAADLGAIVIKDALSRAGVEPPEVDDVVMGCVLQAGAGMNVARQAALKAGLPVEVPAETVNRVCGSGLQAVVHAVQIIAAGDGEVVVAGGTESMSNAPYLLKGVRWGQRMGHGEVLDSMIGDGLTCAINACHMGTTAEEIASRYGISRQEQDAFAAESQRRAEAAIAEGRFAREIVTVEVPQRKGAALRFDRDEYPKAGTTAEALGALRAAFRKEGSSRPATRPASTTAPRRSCSRRRAGWRRPAPGRSPASWRTARPAWTRPSWEWARSRRSARRSSAPGSTRLRSISSS